MEPLFLDLWKLKITLICYLKTGLTNFRFGGGPDWTNPVVAQSIWAVIGQVPLLWELFLQTKSDGTEQITLDLWVWEVTVIHPYLEWVGNDEKMPEKAAKMSPQSPKWSWRPKKTLRLRASLQKKAGKKVSHPAFYLLSKIVYSLIIRIDFNKEQIG